MSRTRLSWKGMDGWGKERESRGKGRKRKRTDKHNIQASKIVTVLWKSFCISLSKGRMDYTVLSEALGLQRTTVRAINHGENLQEWRTFPAAQQGNIQEVTKTPEFTSSSELSKAKTTADQKEHKDVSHICQETSLWAQNLWKRILWTDFSRLWSETLNSWWKRDGLGGPASGRLAVIDAVYVYQEALKVNISHQAHLSIRKTHQIHLWVAKWRFEGSRVRT